MKKIAIVLFTLSCVLFGACSDDETIIEFENVTGISFKGVENNLISLLEQDEYKVEIEIYPEKAQNINEFTEFVFTSSDEAIFTVDISGNIKAGAIGEAILTATAKNDPKILAKCIVKVSLKVFLVEEIKVSEDIANKAYYTGTMIDLGKAVSVLPANATTKRVKYTSETPDIATVTDEGVVEGIQEGKAIISIAATDNSGISKKIEITFVSENKEIEFTPLDRTGWKVTTSHSYISDSGILGTPEALLDGKTGTGLSLKKSYYGKEPIYFTVETAGIEFNAFQLVHRKFYFYLAVQGVDILGSNDGVNFDVIAEDVPVSYKVNSSPDTTKTRIILPEGETAKYKYVRVIYSNLDMSGGQNAQVMEIDFGLGKYK